MGCMISTDESSTDTMSREEFELLKRLNEMREDASNKVSRSELNLIRSTFASLQMMDESAKVRWLEALKNDILSPLHFATSEQTKYTTEFVPDAQVLEQLRQKDFPGIKRSKEDLRELCLYIFHDLLEQFKLDIAKFQRFIFAMSENYQENPFHNFHHAFSVLQMIFSVSERNQKLEAFIEPIDRLALFLSAIGHDLNHPGLTNGFIVNSRHPLALRYNDNNVLENHHAATLIQFLELDGCDFLTDLSIEERTYIRQRIIPIILATDMSNHDSILGNFSEIASNYDKSDLEHRQRFMDVLLHACDLGNPTLKFDLATVWSLNIIKEFNNQVTKEEHSGLPVSEHLRIGNQIDEIKHNQIALIEQFILPLWQLVAQSMPNLSDYVEEIRINKSSWMVIKSL